MVKLGIGAGHGGNDPGAVDYSQNEIERDLARQVVAKLIQDCHTAGIPVVDLTVDEGYPGSVTKPAQIANANNVDYAIQIHFNAGGGNGCEVLHYPGAQALASQMSAAISAATGEPNRGAKVRTDLGFINGTRMIALMPELGFVDDPDRDDVTKVMENLPAVSQAILGCFGIVVPSAAPNVNWPLQNWWTNNTPAQHFRILSNDDGTISFQNRANGKCIDIPNNVTEPGTRIQLHPTNGTMAQKFKLVKPENILGSYYWNSPDNLPYVIVCANNEDNCLDLAANDWTYGNHFITWPRSDLRGVVNDAQYFYLIDRGDGYFAILHAASLGVVDAVGGGI